MKIKTIIAFAFLITKAFAQNVPMDSIVIQAYYNQKNIFVKNSFGTGGIGFCVTGVKVNGNYTTDEINANMFQINLALHKLKQGEKVRIVIKYKKGCAPFGKPLILNPGALLIENSEKKQLSLIYEGAFMWENLFVCNPLVPNTNEYGIKEVIVNGKGLSYTEINSDVFEIRLSQMALKNEIKEGDKLKIEFKYAIGCDPVIINPEALH